MASREAKLIQSKPSWFPMSRRPLLRPVNAPFNVVSELSRFFSANANPKTATARVRK